MRVNKKPFTECKNEEKIKDRYGLRETKIIDYKSRLEDNPIHLKKSIFKNPSKPRFVREDNTFFDPNVFMVATSTLKHNII